MPLKPLPRDIAELTPEWLTLALAERFPGIEVTALETVEVIRGTSTKIRMKASYRNAPETGGPPEALCVKGGFDENLRKFDFLRFLYELEAHFYGKLASRLDVPTIGCWYSEAEDGQGVIILDDLVVKGGTFPRPTTPWQPEQVKRSLALLAGLHAQTWGTVPEDYPWLYKSWEQLPRTVEGCFADEVWNAMMARPDAHFIPEPQRDRARMRRAMAAIAQLMEKTQPWCVVHFDATINNTYLEPGTGEPRFCDWQCASVGPFMIDVAYHIAGALTVADRRTHERDLFAFYLDKLHEAGGPRYTVEEKWLEYRQFEMGMGWLWCTCSTLMQPPATIAAMTERHATACADHETLAALGVA